MRRSKVEEQVNEVVHPEPPLDGYVALVTDDSVTPVTPFTPMRYRPSPKRTYTAGEDPNEYHVDPFALPLEWRNISHRVVGIGLFDAERRLLQIARTYSTAEPGQNVTFTA